ncbi:hypothetical protein BCR34DRAFT_608116 [Clohesyomyces aquaticus]|uniref:T6SS Phospholipase effector Tle1-like catalytic domain-containing protein n=1 Tax=Clohesyomyces aquaticus TaxID=1231657 RepID=A0A1Y1YA90_9PLEO|nr:hypothetical protein BCR34DRAFT_608116 [Clohesyomyces aquaticus]
MAPKKRLFICCDGTGRDSIREKNDYVTNVARFARCIKSTAPDGVLQLVYYHEGVALHNGQFQYREAATGQGIHGMIQDAYYFLCLNFDFDEFGQDEIHLIGFSRGAFAVRALACFIEDVGILAKTRLALLSMVYSLWRRQDLERLSNHIRAWETKGHLKRNVEIASCGVWDTVSAMFPAKDLAFVCPRVPKNLRTAFHALALHETRTSFPPTLWDTDDDPALQGTLVKQCWLAGDHSDIGGGHSDSGLATLALIWMVAQYREHTTVAFAELMLLDCLTPLYLHWQEQAFFNWDEMSFNNRQEYVLQSHIYTKGIVHGPETWSTALWNLPGQSSITIREPHLKLGVLVDTIPPQPKHNAQPRVSDLDPRILHDVNASSLSFTLPDMSYFRPQAANDNTEKTGELSFPTKPWPTVHFTVRILMAARKTPCHLLSRLNTTRFGRNIAWTDVTQQRGLFEDPPTAWESWIFRQWIKREEDMFSKEAGERPHHLSVSGSSPVEERFTRFLYPYRREGERPRKAFYRHEQRASSVDRSRKIMDAEGLRAMSEKAPDLSQSRSSNATSVGSGVKYRLLLDFEGYLPDRYRRGRVL